MARKRSDYGPVVTARIEALTAQGWPAYRIAQDPVVLAAGVSSRTISRRQQELRGPVGPRAGSKAMTPPAPDSAPPVPTSPDDIPSDASLPELADLLRRAKALLGEAEAAKNLPLAGQMIRVIASLAETIRKATPPERPDPNDSPDMVSMGRLVAERLHKMVDLVVKGVV